MFLIRPFRPSDAEPLAVIYRDAVHQLAVGAYDAEQRAAWAPEHADKAAWAGRLANAMVRVAEDKGQAVGFIAFAPDGHIDLLFTAPSHARQGIASALYGTAEEELTAIGVDRLHTEASLVSEPFFSRRGFRIIEEEQVLRNGVRLRRFRMEKRLAVVSSDSGCVDQRG